MKYCTKCGTELVDDAVICTACGRMLQPFPTAPVSAPQAPFAPAKKESATSLLNFIAALALALIYFFWAYGMTVLSMDIDTIVILSFILRLAALALSCVSLCLTAKERQSRGNLYIAILLLTVSVLSVVMGICLFKYI